ncbi:patatin-like phospholipase family protein [Lysobacter korlensis]|uniref:Patatin-like phospholipase family protein n=1 Tax=Lysobacter korlensis TaxID=553636 RepID=A0ABV6RJ80_9GAMM
MAGADAPRIEPGEAVALVLGTGGARGLAQIGVIEALRARSLNIVAIAGSSSGALVGALHAADRLDAFRDWLLGMSRREMLLLLDPTFGAPSLLAGRRLMAALREIAGDPRIEDLPVDFTAVAVDLMRQREVWLREGNLWDAVRASIAIPGVFAPYRIHGRELVDGGLLAPLPITATRLSDAHRLIAVDMHGWPQRPSGAPADPQREDAEVAPPRSRLSRWFARQLSGPASKASPFGFSELMARSLDTMQAQIARVQLALDPPELVIRIPRDVCQFYEFWRARELIDIGRAQADRALDAAGY